MSWEDGTPYVDEVAPGLFAYVQPVGGWMVNNSGFIVDAAGRSVVIDTLATEERNRALLNEIGARSAGGPQIAVNTHSHPDHTYGNGFLTPETVLIGQDDCRTKILAAGLKATSEFAEVDFGNLTVRAPEYTFSDRMTLHLSGFPVELRHVGEPAHTTNDVMIWCPEQSVLFAGDLAFNGGQPIALDGSVQGFRNSLAQIRELAPTVLVPGHGPSVRGDGVPALLDRLDGYMAFIQELAAVTLPEGLTPLQAANQHRDNPYAAWMEPERLVANLHRAYAELPGYVPPGHPLGIPWVIGELEQFLGHPLESDA